MSFADDLRRKSMEYKPQTINYIRVNSLINLSVKAIKKECLVAAEKGKNEIDGLIDILDQDCFRIANVPINKKGVEESTLGLYEGLTREEENMVIDGLRDKVKEMDFAYCAITSLHPTQIRLAMDKRVTSWLTGHTKYVPQYRPTQGFRIEVHIKW